MTQADFNTLVSQATNSLLNCYPDSTIQEETVGLTLYEEGFMKALELVVYRIQGHGLTSKQVEDHVETLRQDL